MPTFQYSFDGVNVPVWRHDIQFEAALVADRERVPHSTAGVGRPPLEQTGSPHEPSNLVAPSTPRFVLNQLRELVDRGAVTPEVLALNLAKANEILQSVQRGDRASGCRLHCRTNQSSVLRPAAGAERAPSDPVPHAVWQADIELPTFLGRGPGLHGESAVHGRL
jgi:hypothetical protein